MRVISRSSHEDLLKCPRKFYLRWLYKGRGYAETLSPIELLVGLSVHKGMEVLFSSNGDVEAAVKAALEERRKFLPQEVPLPLYVESQYLVEALIRGWHRARWEEFHNEWEVLSIEKEVEGLLSSNVLLQGRVDLVARSKMDGRVYAWNWKTTSRKANWTQQWQQDVQAWTEALLSEGDLKEQVVGCIFEGLYKGTTRDGKTSTSLLYFYGYKNEMDEWVEISSEYAAPSAKKPWKKYSAWDTAFPGGKGLRDWINWIPLEELRSYFITSTPIMKNDTVVEGWLKSVVRRETDVDQLLSSASHEDLLVYFEQHFSSAICGRCAFLPACLGRTTVEEMVEEGILVPREEHHSKTVTVEE